MGLLAWIVIGFALGSLVMRSMPAGKRNRTAALGVGIGAAVLGGLLGHGVWDKGAISLTISSTIYAAVVSLVLLEAYRVSALEEPVGAMAEAPVRQAPPAPKAIPPLAEPSAWPPPPQPAAPKAKQKKRDGRAA